MKKALILSFFIIIPLFFSTCAGPGPDPARDYLEEMQEAAVSGSIELGRAAEKGRNRQIEAEGGTPVSFDELFMLSGYIELRMARRRAGDEYLLCLGQLVLNRMASPEFPDSMEEVLLSPELVPGSDPERLSSLPLPGRRAVEAALRLLMGERIMKSSVIYESSDSSGLVYAAFCDRVQGFTYFCESENSALYADAEPLPLSLPPGSAAFSSLNSGELTGLKDSCIIVYALPEEGP